MKNKSKHDNWDFGRDGKLFVVSNIHVSAVKFTSTSKSGLMRKLNNYLKLK